MENILETIQPYILEIIVAILTGVASFIGMKIKKVYEDHVNTKTKKDVVDTTVKYVEQVYKDIHGQETKIIQEKLVKKDNVTMYILPIK